MIPAAATWPVTRDAPDLAVEVAPAPVAAVAEALNKNNIRLKNE